MRILFYKKKELHSCVAFEYDNWYNQHMHGVNNVWINILLMCDEGLNGLLCFFFLRRLQLFTIWGFTFSLVHIVSLLLFNWISPIRNSAAFTSTLHFFYPDISLSLSFSLHPPLFQLFLYISIFFDFFFSFPLIPDLLGEREKMQLIEYWLSFENWKICPIRSGKCISASSLTYLIDRMVFFSIIWIFWMMQSVIFIIYIAYWLRRN